METSAGLIRVGRVEIDVDIGMQWVSQYTDIDRNLTSEEPYAFPAYDRFDGGTARPDRLTDADLLAPTLLNVSVKIRSFYALQGVRARLEVALANPLLGRDLAEMSHGQIRTATAPLYEVLDDEAPWGVQATTLSKILHRKRSTSVVLHDRWVRACYLDTELVPRVSSRSWADYMVLISCAIRDDISTQADQFRLLATTSKGAASLSPVRLLDILAWRSQGGPPILYSAPKRSADVLERSSE